MSRKTSAVAGGDTGTIEQYNKLRDEAEASSRLLAREQSSPDLTLYVSEGSIYFGDSRIDFAGGNSPSFTAPASNPRIDLLSINSSGVLVRTAGAEAGSPSEPSLPAGNLPICLVYNRVGQTSIKEVSDGSNGYIYKDIRVFIKQASANLIKQFTASEDITIGKPVGASNLMENAVARAFTANYSKTITPNMEVSKVQTIQIDTDKVLCLYDETGTTLLRAVVATLNRDDPNSLFTFGSIQTISTTQVSGNKLFDVCKLDAGKFAISYVESGAPTVTRLVIGTISGTTITLGTPVNFDSSTNNVAGLCIVAVDTNRGVVGIGKSTANWRVVAFTASGTVATIGSAVGLDAGFGGASALIACKVATDKFVITTITSSATNGSTQCGTVSGTTITLGSMVAFSATIASDDMRYVQMISPATDVVIIRWNRASSNVGLVCATIATRTLSFGSDLVPTPTNSGGIYAMSATEILCYGSALQNVSKITRSGNTLTENGLVAIRLNVSNINQRTMVDMDGYWLINGISGTTHEYFIEGMANNYIGFAQETVGRGDPISVMLKGVDENQSGLVGGGSYLISNGDLTLVSPIVTVNTLDDTNVVKAISATEVIV